LTLTKFDVHTQENEKIVKQMVQLVKAYNKSVQEEDKLSKEKLIVQRVGKLDPKKHLEQSVSDLMSNNITQCLGTMLDTVTF